MDRVNNPIGSGKRKIVFICSFFILTILVHIKIVFPLQKGLIREARFSDDTLKDEKTLQQMGSQLVRDK